MKIKHLIKIDISIFPSFVDQHLVGGSVYVNHFLLLGVSPPPQLYFLFSKFDLILLGGGVSIKSYFYVGLSLNVDNFFLGIFTICCCCRHRGVSVDALFTIFATDR